MPLQILAGQSWQSIDSMPGDIEMSTEWPGGPSELSWVQGIVSTRRNAGGEKTTALVGAAPVWAGQLLEPDPSQDRMVAQGAFHEAEGFAALDGGGNATTVPNTAIDQAISRGLRWTRPASISGSATEIDISQGPVRLHELLNTWAENNGQRWGVNANREVFAKVDDTIPTYQTLPLDSGLGYSLDGYASTLKGRYFDSGTSSYQTATASVSPDHGYVEDTVDLTGRGSITGARATAILTNLLNLGRAVPKWTSGIELSFGEILSMGGVPVELETVTAGALLRVQGGFELAQRLNGVMYLDVPIGRTQLAGGLLTITPAETATKTLPDAIAAALSRRS